MTQGAVSGFGGPGSTGGTHLGEVTIELTAPEGRDAAICFCPFESSSLLQIAIAVQESRRIHSSILHAHRPAFGEEEFVRGAPIAWMITLADAPKSLCGQG